jgi:anti-sigma factor RsiW
MKPCTHYQDTLLLDVYGELKPQERPEWEKHLEHCEPCRVERERLLILVRTVKATVSSPHLALKKTEGLPRAIQRAWREGLDQKANRKKWWDVPVRFAPALAAACLVIAAASWFSFKELRQADLTPKGRGVVLEEHLASEDLEVVKNLDLLEEMENVEKLVDLLDRRNYGKPSLPRKTGISRDGAYA